MPKEPLFPEGAKSLAPYSPGCLADNIVYTAGIVAIDDEGKTVGAGDIRAQTRAVLEAIRAILAEGGASLDDVVMVQIFVKDYADYDGMNEIYREYFTGDMPARYCIRADLVRPDWLVEMAVTAHAGGR